MTVPRGIRNKNPGNIEASSWTQKQDGYVGKEPEGRFAVFERMEDGIACQLRLLLNYRQRGLDTIRKIINTWAPPEDNNDVSAYAAHVSGIMGRGVDDPLPDDPQTYHDLAYAMACHECGERAVNDQIDRWAFVKAQAAVFGPQAPLPEGSESSPSPPAAVAGAPAEPAPATPKETKMPLPQAALIALGTELLSLIPWVKRNAEESGRIIPKLVEVAKAVVPEAKNEQEAIERVMADPIKQNNFKAEVAMKWSDIAPFLEYESKERREARDFALSLTSDGPQWRQIGAGFLIAILSLTIVVGGGALFWAMMDSPQLDPGQKGLILGALLTAFTTCIGYWFGSSASGRQSGQTVSDIAKSK